MKANTGVKLLQQSTRVDVQISDRRPTFSEVFEVIKKSFERICALLIVALMALPAQSATPGTLEFSSSAYSVTQNAGSVRFTVKRSGGSDGKAAVHYQTSD